MAVKKARPKKKFYTVAEANATLPLIRVIVRDITELAQSLRERHDFKTFLAELEAKKKELGVKSQKSEKKQ